MKKSKEKWIEDRYEVEVNNKMLKKLRKIIEIRVVDKSGKILMHFFKGELKK